MNSPDFRHYVNLVLHKAWADFRAEAERTYLGVAWWALEPLVDLMIYYYIFGTLLNRGHGDYLRFLLVGVVMWRFFAATLSRGSVSIYGNIALVRQISFHKVIFPLITAITCAIEFLFSLALLFAFLLFLKVPITIHYAAFPVILGVEFLFTMAITMPLAAIVPLVPDLQRFIQYAIRIGFFVSSIMISLEHLAPEVQAVLRFNPFIPIVEGCRDVLLYNRWPDWTALGLISLASAAATGLGMVMIFYLDPIFAKRVTR